MDTKQIVIGIVIVLVIYLLYLWFFGDGTRTYLMGMHHANKQHIISPSTLPKGGTSDYTYSIWLYINNWNYRVGEKKDIFARYGSSDKLPAPVVSLGANMNNVEVSLGTWPGHGTSGSSDESGVKQPGIHTCTLDNVPLQAWANVIMTLNNRSLDLYLDGKLVRTCVLPGVPVQESGAPLVVCGQGPNGGAAGFDGFISNFQYFARAVNPREAYAIYREGPGGSNWMTNLINKYRIKVAFMKNNTEVNSFEI